MSQSAPFNRFPRQSGGSSASDWKGSFNSGSMPVDLQSKLTASYIDDSPMFHPLEPGRQIATPWATGIYPVGIYYMNQAAVKQCGKMPSCIDPNSAVKRQIVPSATSGKDNIAQKLQDASN